MGEDAEAVVKIINEELIVLYRWLKQNGLSLNTDKTKFMIIKSRFNSIPTKGHSGVFINNQRIEQVQECKYLGVVVDEHLTFSKHAEYITKKIAKKVYLLGRMSNYLSEWSKLTIYKAIILPHFNYCSSILFLLNNAETNTLQKKQNQAMRYMLGCNRYTAVSSMLSSTGILSVKQIIFINTMSLIYRIKQGLCPEHLMQNLRYNTDVHNYQTRAREDFYVDTVSNNYSQNDLFHSGLIHYNNLPHNVKSSNTVEIFKKRCGQYCKSIITV